MVWLYLAAVAVGRGGESFTYPVWLLPAIDTATGAMFWTLRINLGYFIIGESVPYKRWVFPEDRYLPGKMSDFIRVTSKILTVEAKGYRGSALIGVLPGSLSGWGGWAWFVLWRKLGRACRIGCSAAIFCQFQLLVDSFCGQLYFFAQIEHGMQGQHSRVPMPSHK
jgi:hypothetical protein